MTSEGTGRPGADSRRARRRTLEHKIPARIFSVDGTSHFRCHVSDISETGAKIATSDAQKIPDTFFLSLSETGGAHRSCTVVWRSAKDLGVRFARPDAKNAI